MLKKGLIGGMLLVNVFEKQLKKLQEFVYP